MATGSSQVRSDVEPGMPRVKADLIIESTADGLYFRCGKLKAGPYDNKEEIDDGMVAQQLGVEPKQVFLAKLKAFGLGFQFEYAPTMKSPPERPVKYDDFCDAEKRFVPAKLAEWVMGQYTFITMMDNQETFVYMNGFYQPLGDALIKKLVKEALGDEYRKNRTTEVQDYIKAATFTARREEPPNLIPLENGVLDVSKDPPELKPHSPNYLFFNRVPVKYDP